MLTVRQRVFQGLLAGLVFLWCCELGTTAVEEGKPPPVSEEFLERVEYIENLPNTAHFTKLSAASDDTVAVPRPEQDTPTAPEDQEQPQLLPEYCQGCLVPPLYPALRVAKSPHWRWGFAAGHMNTLGTVVANASTPGWFVVRWDNGHTNTYQYDAQHRDLEVWYDQHLPDVTIVRKVPTIQWVQEPTSPFANLAAQGDEPIVIQNSSALLWPAMSKWVPEYLSSHIGAMEGVKVTPTESATEPTSFFYYHQSPMTSHSSLEGSYKQRAYERVSLPSDEALAYLQRGTNGTHSFSWTGMLDDLPDTFLPDVVPLYPFMVIQPGFDPKREHLFRQTRVWLSGPGTTTPGHFDLFHNFYVQIHGNKTFTLFPPMHWERLYPYPLLHPAGRSIQVDLLKPASQQDKAKFPHFEKEFVTGLNVTLQPGDVLYIPPLWFHHVTAHSFSVSVSVWSPDMAIEVAAKASESVPLPIKTEWGFDMRIAALRATFESLVESLDLGMSTSEFVAWALLDSRYRVIGAQLLPETSRHKYCYDEDVFNQVLAQGEELVRAQLKSLVKIFKDVRKFGGADRLHIELANYFELAANAVVGVEQVKQLFFDIALC